MCFFFFNDTATTEIYTYGHTLSLHDALPAADGAGGGGRTYRAVRSGACRIGGRRGPLRLYRGRSGEGPANRGQDGRAAGWPHRDCRRVEPRTESGDRRDRRTEEHTSELQSLMRLSYAVL